MQWVQWMQWIYRCTEHHLSNFVTYWNPDRLGHLAWETSPLPGQNMAMQLMKGPNSGKHANINTVILRLDRINQKH